MLLVADFSPGSSRSRSPKESTKWQPYALKSTRGETINQVPLLYADFLLEAGLFLLTTALRKLFTEGHDEQIADQSNRKHNSRCMNTATKTAAAQQSSSNEDDEKRQSTV